MTAASGHAAPLGEELPQLDVVALAAALLLGLAHVAVGARQAVSTASENSVPLPRQLNATATAVQMSSAAATALDDLSGKQVFRICGMIVGAVIIVFGLCMLAYYTPDDAADGGGAALNRAVFDTYQMNGSTPRLAADSVPSASSWAGGAGTSSSGSAACNAPASLGRPAFDAAHRLGFGAIARGRHLAPSVPSPT